MTLSEELQEQAAAQRTEFQATESQAASAAEMPDLQVLWTPMIAIAASVAAAVSVLSVAAPSFAVMAWVAPVVALAIYSSRYRKTSLTAGVGARVGLVSGIFSGFGISSAAAIRLVALHHSTMLAAQMKASMEQSKAIMAGWGAPQDQVATICNQPECKAGMVLWLFACYVAALLVLSTASGAASGFVFSKVEKR